MIGQAKEGIEKHLLVVDGQLVGKSYLVAETFTLGDLCYLPFLEFLPLMEITPPANVAAWAQRLLSSASHFRKFREEWPRLRLQLSCSSSEFVMDGSGRI